VQPSWRFRIEEPIQPNNPSNEPFPWLLQSCAMAFQPASPAPTLSFAEAISVIALLIWLEVSLALWRLASFLPLLRHLTPLRHLRRAPHARCRHRRRHSLRLSTLLLLLRRNHDCPIVSLLVHAVVDIMLVLILPPFHGCYVWLSEKVSRRHVDNSIIVCSFGLSKFVKSASTSSSGRYVFCLTNGWLKVKSLSFSSSSSSSSSSVPEPRSPSRWR